MFCKNISALVGQKFPFLLEYSFSKSRYESSSSYPGSRQPLGHIESEAVPEEWKFSSGQGNERGIRSRERSYCLADKGENNENAGYEHLSGRHDKMTSNTQPRSDRMNCQHIHSHRYGENREEYLAKTYQHWLDRNLFFYWRKVSQTHTTTHSPHIPVVANLWDI